jgi:hypothetical protein
MKIQAFHKPNSKAGISDITKTAIEAIPARVDVKTPLPTEF